MGARAESMATIDLALSGPPLDTGEADVAIPPASALDPSIAPGIDAPAPLSEGLDSLTADQKRAIDAKYQADDRAAAAAKKAEDERQALFTQQQRAQQENEDAFQRSSRLAYDNLRGIVRGTGVRLGNIPTPGSIMFPLLTLLVFFFLLVPVNGHTRFVWLWLVLSGNAEINQNSDNPPSPGDAAQPVGGALGSSSNTPAIPALPSPLPLPAPLLPFAQMTGAQEIL